MQYIDGYNLMMIMRNTLNKIDPRLIDHGHRVAYMVWKIALHEGSFHTSELRDLTITALLHDIGAYKTDEIDKMVQFETEEVQNHSIYGYLFLKYLSPLKHYAHIILCHHVPYKELIQYHILEWKWIQILTLCDRFDVLMGIYHDSNVAMKKIQECTKTLFAPEVVDLFLDANKKFHFVETIYIYEKDLHFDILVEAPYTTKELRSYLNMITYAIDFRSQFMVTHTMTTNRISIAIGNLLQLDEDSLKKIDIGSILHDLGKMAIPIEILDFPGKLNDEQMDIMRTHVKHTQDILDHYLDEDIIHIAIRHHEKLNGKGYPLGLDSRTLNTNERIVAIADIMSALYEQRSYKGAFNKKDIFAILESEVTEGNLDGELVQLALKHFDTILSEVHAQCDPMIQAYKDISLKYESISNDFEGYLSSF